MTRVHVGLFGPDPRRSCIQTFAMPRFAFREHTPQRDSCAGATSKPVLLPTSLPPIPTALLPSALRHFQLGVFLTLFT